MDVDFGVLPPARNGDDSLDPVANRGCPASPTLTEGSVPIPYHLLSAIFPGKGEQATQLACGTPCPQGGAGTRAKTPRAARATQ